MPKTHTGAAYLIKGQGANSYGQLGQGHQRDRFLPQYINNMPDNVTDIIGGGGHTLFLTANGRCYSCGWNSKGQLGLGLEGQQNEVTVPKPISEQYFSESFIKVAAGWDHSMTITESGSLYSFGSNAFGQLGSGKSVAFSSTPELVPNPEECKQDVACGMRHSIILAGNDVYTCGSGRKGQLGYCGPDGKPVSKSDNFMKVPLPDCCGRIIQVAAGANHSALVTDTGQLIVWGDNKHGQLAMDPDLKPVQHEPVILPEHLFEKEKIVQVYSGWTHMLALTETGLVYTWGRAKYGQLGTAGASDEKSSRWQPHLLAITNPKRIVCGAEHNMLISDGDELLTWGWNEHGMCGSGDTVDIFEPQKIQSFTDWKVTAIGCGSGHSFACVTS